MGKTNSKTHLISFIIMFVIMTITYFILKSLNWVSIEGTRTVIISIISAIGLYILSVWPALAHRYSFLETFIFGAIYGLVYVSSADSNAQNLPTSNFIEGCILGAITYGLSSLLTVYIVRKNKLVK